MKQSDIKHLLILTPGFPKDEQDTTCLPAVQQFVLCYKKAFPECTISIISLHYPRKAAKYMWDGIEVAGLGGGSKPGIRRQFIMLKAVRQAISINRNNKIDTILSFWLTDTSLAGKICSRLLGIQHFIWMHGQDAKAGNRYYNRVKPKPEKLIAISDFQNDVFCKAYGVKAKHVVHNGIDVEKFPDLNNGKRTIDLFAAGYLNKLKRYHFFIELIIYLKEHGFDNIKAVLAGGGLLANELKELTHAHGLDNNIEFTGEIPHDEVLRLMNNSKLFVHTSEYEGHSSVLIEALYSGCKVLSFMPVDTEAVDGFKLCKDFKEMKQECLELLKSDLNYTRGKQYSMTDSVKKIASIFNQQV